MSDVVNTAFYMPFGLRGVTEADATTSLAQDLLCYDTVWVLSTQMSAVAPVFSVMGARAFEEALQRGALRFIRDTAFLAWPKVDGRKGLVPVLLGMTVPNPKTGERGRGMAAWPTGVLASTALSDFDLPAAANNHLSRLVADSTVTFGNLPDKPGTEGALDGAGADLRRFAEIVEHAPGMSVTRRELLRLAEDVAPGRGRRSKFETQQLGLWDLSVRTGADALREHPAIAAKQLDIVHLVLAERFGAAHALVPGLATLHTEPVVEDLVRARLEGPRLAAGIEIEEILDARRVYLPTPQQPDNFPFEELLLARDRADAVAFRRLVKRRDQLEDERLIRAFIDALGDSLAERMGVRALRLLVTGFVGTLGGVPGALAGFFDQFATGNLLGRLGAPYFIDGTLARIARTHDADGTVRWPLPPPTRSRSR